MQVLHGHGFNLGEYQRAQLLSCKSMFSFVRNCQTFPNWHTVLCFTNSISEFLLFRILYSIWCYHYFESSHSNRHAVVSHCLNFHFPDEIFCDISLPVLICCLSIFFGELSVKVLGPFLNRVIFVLNFKSSWFLFFFPNSPLSGIYLANIFSQSVVIFLLSCRAEVFNVNNVQLINIFTISFIDCAFGVISKTFIAIPKVIKVFF